MLGELDQRARERSLFDEKLELERLRSKHLPALLRSYADIPPEHRAEIFRETGRSASFLLNERLDKIHGRLEEMSRQLARGNLDAFAENIRFVDTKYGASVALRLGRATPLTRAAPVTPKASARRMTLMGPIAVGLGLAHRAAAGENAARLAHHQRLGFGERVGVDRISGLDDVDLARDGWRSW